MALVNSWRRAQSTKSCKQSPMRFHQDVYGPSELLKICSKYYVLQTITHAVSSRCLWPQWTLEDMLTKYYVLQTITHAVSSKMFMALVNSLRHAQSTKSCKHLANNHPCGFILGVHGPSELLKTCSKYHVLQTIAHAVSCIYGPSELLKTCSKHYVLKTIAHAVSSSVFMALVNS